ncbi:PTS sugar transporter subunit IIA [Thermaerobacter litoralis]
MAERAGRGEGPGPAAMGGGTGHGPAGPGANGTVRAGGGAAAPAGGNGRQPEPGGVEGGVAVPSPLTGRVVPLDQVPDPVFAERMVGDGVAVRPEAGEVLAPLPGTVTALFPTGHAVGLRTPDGIEILIHLGIDSAHAEGAFEPLVQVGDWVEAGQLLIRIDLRRLEAAARSPVSPILVTNLDERGGRIEAVARDTVMAGRDVLFRVAAPGGAPGQPAGPSDTAGQG